LFLPTRVFHNSGSNGSLSFTKNEIGLHKCHAATLHSVQFYV